LHNPHVRKTLSGGSRGQERGGSGDLGGRGNESGNEKVACGKDANWGGGADFDRNTGVLWEKLHLPEKFGKITKVVGVSTDSHLGGRAGPGGKRKKKKQ